MRLRNAVPATLCASLAQKMQSCKLRLLKRNSFMFSTKHNVVRHCSYEHWAHSPEALDVLEHWQGVGASQEFRNVREALQQSLEEMFAASHAQEQIVFPAGDDDDSFFLRNKVQGGYTWPHADYQYNIGSLASLYKKLGARTTSQSSSVCLVCHPDTQDSPVLCASCAAKDLPFYTAWVCLDCPGGHSSLLLFADGSNLPEKQYLYSRESALPTKHDGTPLEIDSLSWVLPNATQGDVFVFSSRTIHAAAVHKPVKPRLSMDVRFIVQSAVRGGKQEAGDDDGDDDEEEEQETSDSDSDSDSKTPALKKSRLS